MKRGAPVLCALLSLRAMFPAAGAPGAVERRPPAAFPLPAKAKTFPTPADGGGWAASGEISVSFEQAKSQFAARASAAGWTHMHTIPLDRNRSLEAWRRDGIELTLMIWRIAPGRSGFSCGTSSKADVKK